MAIEKKVFIDETTVSGNGVINVREATQILEDGNIIGNPLYRRWCLEPEQDISNECAQVKAIANAVWTDEVIAEYKASLIPSLEAQNG